MQDRRLDQDDNRGLGQPVHDNVPLTRSTFRLFLESNRPSSGPSSFRSSQSHPVLSLLSQLSLQSLSNPYVLLFDPTPQESPPSIRIQDLPGLPQDLPCDVHLLNLRTAVAQESDQGVVSAFSGSDATGGATALMLLHRVGVDCRRQSTMSKLKCQPLKGKLDLKSSFAKVFSLPFVEEGSPSPLAGRGALLPVDATVTLDVMHVHSFRFPLI
jgi:alpha-mannosidase II